FSLRRRDRALPAADGQIEHFTDATLYRQARFRVRGPAWRRQPRAGPPRCPCRHQMLRGGFDRLCVHREIFRWNLDLTLRGRDATDRIIARRALVNPASRRLDRSRTTALAVAPWSVTISPAA